MIWCALVSVALRETSMVYAVRERLAAVQFLVWFDSLCQDHYCTCIEIDFLFNGVLYNL